MAFWADKNLPRAHYPEKAESALDQLAADARERRDDALLKLLKIGENKALITSLAGNSPYLAQLMLRNPLFLKRLLTREPGELFKSLLEKTAAKAAGTHDRDAFMRVIRALKSRAALLIAACDISGFWDLDATTEALTRLADLTLQLSLAHILFERMDAGKMAWPDGRREKAAPKLARNSGFVALSLGKLGARSLNYSSDIDLILLYDEERIRLNDQLPKPFFTKVAQNLVSLMQERTAEGYVFRVDLRLRPDPGTTPPAVSFAAAEVYYQSVAETWERAAMIKARVSAGDFEAGHDFLTRIRHFVWRRHMDFAAVRDIHAIKDRIFRHYGHRDIKLMGHDLKVGEGGIRSIEFFCQIHQLIAGGRNLDLRTASTRSALKALKAAHIVDATTAKQMTDAYIFLRTVEHRLQMINDEQTQLLPHSEDGMAHLAAFMGFRDPGAFKTRLLGTLSVVKRLYETLPGTEEEETTPAFLQDREALGRRLLTWGFAEKTAETIEKWRSGTYKALKSPRARRIFDALLPDLLETFSRGTDPDRTISRFDDFLSKLPSGVQVLSLFQNNPWVLQVIAKILSTAPFVAEELARRPDLFDFVLDPTFFDPLRNKKALEKSLAAALRDARDYEEILEGSRRWLNEMRFQVGVHLLEQLASSSEAGRFRANLAEVILAAILPHVTKDFETRNGKIKNGEMAIIALGSFGGRELTLGSDLDLVLLFSAPEEARAKNGQGLAASQYYIRLGQHFLTALSAMMGSGRLYDIDLRLRPSGRWGPLVVTLQSFLDYQKGSAWTLEHMALTRARVVFAGAKFKKAIEAAIAEILCMKRSPKALAQQMDEMRLKYYEEYGTGNIWAVRQARGALIDVEYIVQFHLLRSCWKNPKIVDPDFATALANLVKTKALPKKDAAVLEAAHDLYLEMHGLLRLCHKGIPVEDRLSSSLLGLLASAAGAPSPKALAAKLRSTESEVSALYQKHISRYVESGRQ